MYYGYYRLLEDSFLAPWPYLASLAIALFGIPPGGFSEVAVKLLPPPLPRKKAEVCRVCYVALPSQGSRA